MFIGRYFGIPLKLHWSFFLLVPFVMYYGHSEEEYWKSIAFLGSFVLLVFVCVVLHEYGHALMARRFGVGTLDVILSPIGGVARLRNMPEKPAHELWIALAGPFVNVVIAALMTGLLFVLQREALLGFFSGGTFEEMAGELESQPNSLGYVMLVGVLALNLTLVLFNMLPAFPMDGGRVLRALLAMRLGRLRATRIASIIGQIIAIGFVIFAISNSHFSLGLIGVFVFMMASKEYQSVKMDALLSEHTVADVMRTDFANLHETDTMLQAAALQGQGLGRHFLVKDESGALMGALYGPFIEEAIRENKSGECVRDFTSSQMEVASPQHKLRAVYEAMANSGSPLAAVFDEKLELVGIIEVDDINRFLQAQQKKSVWSAIFQKKS